MSYTRSFHFNGAFISFIVNATGGDAEAWFMPDILVDVHKAGGDSDLGVIRDVSVCLLPFTNSSFKINKVVVVMK